MDMSNPIRLAVRFSAALLLCRLTAVSCIQLDGCRLPLGVTSGTIEDEQMTSSSSYDENNTGPRNARVNVERAGGAWCPRPQISVGVREHLQVALSSVQVISGVLTQGRYGQGRGMEYTEAFYLEYWRSGVGWVNYTLWNGDTLLPGNTDVGSVKENTLVPLIIASKVRFIPYSSHPRTVCLRVELLGCPYSEGIVSYSTRQGDIFSSGLRLADDSYDGRRRLGFLSQGLGQLTDGAVGAADINDNIGHGHGYEWVGWTSNISEHYPVEITLQFSSTRNFTSLNIHTNVDYTSGIQMFAMVRVFFSADGSLYDPRPVLLYPPALRVSRQSRIQTVQLDGRTGHFVKLQLFFRLAWIIISEISFDSVVCESPCISADRSGGVPIPHNDVWRARPQDIRKIISLRVAEGQSGLSGGQMGLVVGLCSFLLIVLALLGAAIYWRNQRRKSSPLTYTTFTGPFGDRKVTITMKDMSHKMGLRPFAGGLARAKGPIFCPSAQTPADEEATAVTSRPPAAAPGADKCTLVVNPCSEDVVAVDRAAGLATPAVSRRYELPASCRSGSSSDLSETTSCETRPFGSRTLPVRSVYEDGAATPPRAPPLPDSTSSTSGSRRSAHHHSTPRKTQRRLREQWSHSEEPIDRMVDQLLGADVDRIPSSSLQLQERMGAGQFGELLLCRSENEEYPVVIAKCVRGNPTREQRQLLCRDLSLARRVRHPHICAVVAVCEEPLALLVLHSRHGDLNQYLQRHVSETSSVGSGDVLSYGSLLHLAGQIANGMSFLEDNGLVHKDLATRNCVVFDSQHVRLTDTAAGRDLYSADYCQLDQNSRLPLRWLAWESLFMGQYTSASDVWSFGATLWEILTFAREPPLAHLSDDHVLANLELFFRNDRAAAEPTYLEQPFGCSADLYDLMLECWRRNSADRPSFRQIYLFLQRCNLPFLPSDAT